MKQFEINKAALITCDTYSKFISKNNRTCRTIFGDAITLSILEKSKKAHFLNFKLGSDATGFKNFILKNGEIFRSNKKILLNTVLLKPKFGCSTKNIYAKVKTYSKAKLNKKNNKQFEQQFLTN